MEIPYTVSPRRDTGLFNAKIGIWLFLASEVMLFGGLFSAYVFLRVGARPGIDVPWPEGIDVHGKFIWLGFANTLVLIGSSVFVVMAWAQLKLRRWRAFQGYMGLVLACAAVFMVIKTVEYNSKLNHHFGVRLVDGTLIDGKLAYDEEHGCKGDVVTFRATEANFSLAKTGPLRRIDPYFLDFAVPAEGQELVFTHEGQEIRAHELKGWLEDYSRMDEDAERVALALQEPTIFQFKRSDVFGNTLFPTTVPFYRGNGLKGELVDASVEVEIHTLDLQMTRDLENSLAWAHLEDGYREGFEQHKKDVLEKYESWVDRGGVVPAHKLLKWKHAHPVHHQEEHGGAGEEEGEGHGKYDVVSIPNEDIRFMGSHGPKFGPYYSIYFTMTGLHGLHVIGGAIVLGYFLFFGQKMYRKNPEHLANRVEVGGLFWHFVDLVWIFLFPIMYLM